MTDRDMLLERLRALWRALVPLSIRRRFGAVIRAKLALQDLEVKARRSNVAQWRGYEGAWREFVESGERASGPPAGAGDLVIDYDPSGVRLSGWHSYGSFWWMDPRSPYAFKYVDLDGVYPEAYFERDAHPDTARATDLVAWICAEYAKLTGRELTSVLELGSGAGNIAVAFAEQGVACTTVEGTASGCERLIAEGVPEERVIRADLRTWEGLGRRFDLVMCTEVLEHVELPFVGRVVQLACAHADHVWFSSPSPGPLDSPKRLWQGGDYEHCSCMPLRFWDELFAFCGRSRFVVLDPFDCTRRGMRLYYPGPDTPADAGRAGG